MNIGDVRRVLIIGAGNMGQQIGFQCAASGYEVALYDVGKDAVDKAMDRIVKLAKTYITAGRLTEEEAGASIKRISTSIVAEEAGRNSDFVSESVPEDPDLKGRVFAMFDKICPPHAVFTTNTSSLLPSMFAEATGRPGKFAAFHFHDVRFSNIVDIMPHPGTTEETIELIEAFAGKIGQTAIMLKKENNGYVFNAMLMQLLSSAQTLAANGVAAIEDIDRSWMGVMHTMVGPFGIMDSIGLDTVWKVTGYWADKTKDPQSIKNALFLRQYVDKGLLGVKSGKGFYAYPEPAFVKPGFVEGGKR
jgi:3-hydroxybutyryl-CoA dehydrogenase